MNILNIKKKFNEIQSNPFILGLERSCIIGIAGHPVNVIKVNSQSDISKSSSKIFFEIFKNQGISGFTNGIEAGLTRRIIRGSINLPVITYGQKFLIESNPSLFTKDGTITKIGAAALFAFVDSAFLYPCDLLMTYKIRENSYKTFYKNRFSNQGISSLFDGAKINFFMQLTIWGISLGVNNEIHKKFSAFDKKQEYRLTRELISASLVATALGMFALPMDFVKTRIQNDPSLQSKKTVVLIRELTTKYGFKGFYSGFPIVWCYNVFASVILNRFLDKIMK